MNNNKKLNQDVVVLLLIEHIVSLYNRRETRFTDLKMGKNKAFPPSSPPWNVVTRSSYL